MARPGARRQLSGAGPLLLWRDRQDKAREGLLLSVSVCESRFCTMRHVLVEGVRVEEELHFAWVEGGEIVALGPLDTDVGPRPAFLVSVDVDRGNITPQGDDGPQDRDAIAWLRAELDDELMGVLRERFFRARGGIDTAAAAVRRAPRAGRNDPCPCGSGKKFKRCCL